jgi:hypothetical protein
LQPTFGYGGGGGGGGSNAPAPRTEHGGYGKQGTVGVTYTPAFPAFQTLLLHRPSRFTPQSLMPCTPVGSGSDIPDGTTPYVIAGTDPSIPAGFGGTYSVLLVARAYDNPTAPRTVTVTFNQYAYPGDVAFSQPVAASIIPNSQVTNGFTWLGEITLPLLDLPPENLQAYVTATITSTDPADRFLDLILLDTQGSTVLVNSPGTAAQMYVDPPDVDRDWGRILATDGERDQAESIMQNATVSGPPLSVEPGDNNLLAYCIEGAPSLAASYVPRWRMDRVAT